jgi:uncharacterized protein involved in type VI secretion and phage assembly
MPENLTITVDGQAQPELEGSLREVLVDTNLYLPAMFAITLVDELDLKTEKLKYIPDEMMTVKAVLIIGEVTAIEPLFEEDGRPAVRIRGYDRSHHLTRGKKTRTYGDANPTGQGIDDATIIQTIVGETQGITAKKVDTSGLSGIKYPYVMQYNQTDLEFLWDRARLYGYQVYVDDKTLHFEKADAHRGNAGDKPAVLRWRWGLRSFRPRLTLMGQVDRAVVKGWEPDKKSPLEGTNNSDSSKTIPAIGLNKKGSQLAKEALKGEADEVVLDHPVYTVNEAKAIAGARFAGAESEFIQADGECRTGDPRLIAGRLVTIEGVGERFSGDYYVTEARHLYQRGRYEVSFSVSGRSLNTLSHLLGSDNGHQSGRAFGVVPAKVVSLEDPQDLGRVQLMYPWLPKYKSADLSSSWARLANPMGGADRGFLFLPEIDDEVLVGFEHGDVNRPYVLGTLWNNTDKPPTGTAEILASDKKKVDQRVIRSRSGHLVVLNDKENEEQVVITSKSGHTVILDDKQGSESITIKDKTGKNTMVIDSAKNSMSINVEGDFSVTAKGKITLTSTQDLTLDTKAMGNLKSAGNMTVKATGNLSLQATGMGELKGTASATVDGGPMTTIKGALVKIN